MSNPIDRNDVVEPEQDVEGLEGPPEESSFGDYPIDTLLIRMENRTVHDVLRRIEQGSFVMDPDFQRDFVWDESQQSRLIESVLMRIPLPVLYLAEDSEGRMIVVDGLQRLSTFKRFVDNGLRLKLPGQPELDRMKFQDLSAKLQNRIEDCNLILYVIDSKVPERARLDIFERVNSGVPLTRQQMRNCLFVGPATRFLKDESNSELFLEATGHSLKSQTMRDREFVNRYCAFKLIPLDEYRDMDEFLAKALSYMNDLDEESLQGVAADLHRGLANNIYAFEHQAFRKHEPDQGHRNIINASLWDVMSVGLSCYSEDIIEDQYDFLREGFYELLDDDEFVLAITYGTNTPRQVRKRFEMSRDVLREVFGDYPN